MKNYDFSMTGEILASDITGHLNVLYDFQFCVMHYIQTKNRQRRVCAYYVHIHTYIHTCAYICVQYIQYFVAVHTYVVPEQSVIPFSGLFFYLFLFLCAYSLDGECNEQLFTDACKGVIQRCIFLLLGLRTSFPVDSELLSIITNANKAVRKQEVHGLTENSGLYICITESTVSTSGSGSPGRSPRSEVSTQFVVVKEI